MFRGLGAEGPRRLGPLLFRRSFVQVFRCLGVPLMMMMCLQVHAFRCFGALCAYVFYLHRCSCIDVFKIQLN